jgi:hypothetical protein
MSKKQGKKEGKSSRSNGSVQEDKSNSKKNGETKPAFTDEQMANPFFRAAVAFRNNPGMMSDSLRGMMGSSPAEEPKKDGPNFMQRLVARAANDANALCILGSNQFSFACLHFAFTPLLYAVACSAKEHLSQVICMLPKEKTKKVWFLFVFMCA